MSLINISQSLESLKDDVKTSFINENAIRIFHWICFMTMQVVDIFGTVTNIINIICFVKQGFKDPVNISFLGLAVSDLGSAITLIWTNICGIPAFQEADLPFDSMDIQYLTAAWPHIVFTRITSWITAIITVERCLCITMPLKVKNIITPKRVTAAIVCIFLVMIFSVTPLYYVTGFGMIYSEERNKTILGLTFRADRFIVEQIFFIVANVFVPFSAFLVIIICTTVLYIKLWQQLRWRENSVKVVQGGSTMEKEQKVAKMVLIISALFISCFIPSGIVFLAMALEPELAMGGKYEKLIVSIYATVLLLESINSSMNIFIYYRMSTKYKTTFHQMFSKRRASELVRKP